MSYQEQYHLFKKALFSNLTQAEEVELQAARKDPVFDAAFQDYLETASSILRVEEKAAEGQEHDLAYRFAQQKTNAGENLYVEFRMRHDKHYAQLVADAKEIIEDFPEQEETSLLPVAIAVKEEATEQSPEVNQEATSLPQELPGNMAETTATVRRLIPRKTKWYIGIAATVLLFVVAGLWTANFSIQNRDFEANLSQEVKQQFYISNDGLGGGSFSPNITLSPKELEQEIKVLISQEKYVMAEEKLAYFKSQNFQLNDVERSNLISYEIIAIANQGLDEPNKRDRALSLIDQRLNIWLNKFDKTRNPDSQESAKEVASGIAEAEYERILIKVHDEAIRADQIIELEKLLAPDSPISNRVRKKATSLLDLLKNSK